MALFVESPGAGSKIALVICSDDWALVVGGIGSEALEAFSFSDSFWR